MRPYDFWVYIVQCRDGKYYTGITNNLDRRLYEHNEGLNKNCFTYIRRPVVLKYEQHFNNVTDAISWEKQLKGWSRKKKEALMKGDMEELKKLSKSSRHSSSSSE